MSKHTDKLILTYLVVSTELYFRKETKYQVGKEVKLSVFSDGLIFYIENILRNPIKKTNNNNNKTK